MSFEETELYTLLDPNTPVTDDLCIKALTYLRSPEATEKKVTQLQSSEDGSTYLHRMAALPSTTQDQLLPIIYQLYNMGMDLNIVDKKDNTPLHSFIANNGSWRAIQALQRLGANPYITNDIGKLPKDLFQNETTKYYFERMVPNLWDAVDRNDPALVEELLGAWCFPHVGTTMDGTKLDIVDLAKSKGPDAEVIVKLLQEYSPTLEFVRLTLAGDVEEMKKMMIGRGASVNVNVMDAMSQPDIRGDVIPMPLLVAAITQVPVPEVAEVLLENKANASQYYDGTFPRGPSFLTTILGDPKPTNAMVMSVLKQADLSQKNHRGQTVLYDAMSLRSDLVADILNLNINIADRDCNGHTILDEALYYGLTDMCQLYEHHLTEMILSGDTDKLEKLIHDGFDRLHELKVEGTPVRDVADRKGQTGIVALLDQASGIQFKVQQLHEAVRAGNLDKVKTLSDAKLALAKDKGGRNVLHIAALHSKADIVNFVVEMYPATLTACDNMYRTPLHYATALESGDEIFTRLMLAGADDKVTDCNNLSPRDYQEEIKKPQRTPGEQLLAQQKELFDVKTMIRREMDKRYGFRIYLKLTYNLIKKEIEARNLEGVEKLAETLDCNINDFVEEGLGLKPLIILAVENADEDIAKCLMDRGADLQVTWQDQSLLQVVQLANMKSLLKLLMKKLNLDDEMLDISWSPSRRSSASSLKSDKVPCPVKPQRPKKKFPAPTTLDAKYLAHHLGETLQLGLAEVCEKRPWDPIEFLAHWLYKHAQNLKADDQVRENAYKMELEKAEEQKEVLRKKRRIREAERLKWEEAERKRREAEEAERRRIRQEEEERRLKELEEMQRRQREGDTYSQAPDLATVSEESEEISFNMTKLQQEEFKPPPEPEPVPEEPTEEAAATEEPAPITDGEQTQA